MSNKQDYSRISSETDETFEDASLNSGAIGSKAQRRVRGSSFTISISHIVSFGVGIILGVAIMLAAQNKMLSSALASHDMEHSHSHAHPHSGTQHVHPNNGVEDDHYAEDVHEIEDGDPGASSSPDHALHRGGSPGGFVFSPKTGEAKCGHDWHEAKALGCHFDVMASRWYSDECFNGPVLEQMLKEVDFEWYYDPEHTRPAPRDVVVAGEFEKVYPSGDYHIMHCLYLWRRLHRAVIDGKHLDDDVYDYGHTLHCSRMIMEWPKGINTTTFATSGIPYCRNTAMN